MKEQAILKIIDVCKRAITMIEKHESESGNSKEPVGVKIRYFGEAVAKLGEALTFFKTPVEPEVSLKLAELQNLRQEEPDTAKTLIEGFIYCRSQLVHYVPYDRFMHNAITPWIEIFIKKYLPRLKNYLLEIEKELSENPEQVCTKEVPHPRHERSSFTLHDFLYVCSSEIQMLIEDLQSSYYDKLPRDDKIFGALFSVAFDVGMDDYRETFLYEGGLTNYIRGIYTILRDYLRERNAQEEDANLCAFYDMEKTLFKTLSRAARLAIMSAEETRTLLAHETLDATDGTNEGMGKRILSFKELHEKYLIPLVMHCQKLGIESKIQKGKAVRAIPVGEESKAQLDENVAKYSSTSILLSKLHAEDDVGRAEKGMETDRPDDSPVLEEKKRLLEKTGIGSPVTDEPQQKRSKTDP